MKKLFMVAAAIGALGVGVAAARTINVWGQMFEIDEPHQMTVEAGVLTDPVTKHHMNYIKLKNGHMMAVVPMEQYMSLYSMTRPDDMLQ